MSYSIDANILIYASNQESDFHNKAKAFMSACIENSEPIYLCWPTVFAYLRISTHPHIFTSPLTPKEAIQNIETLKSLPQVRLINEGDHFWEHYSEACKGQIVRGNLVPDAHVAALLRENGIRRLFSRDRDFFKFTFLDVRDPFA